MQNILILTTLAWSVTAVLRKSKGQRQLEPLSVAERALLVSAFSLVVLGFATSIEVNNLGRLLSVLTPASVPLLVRNIASWACVNEQANEATAGGGGKTTS